MERVAHTFLISLLLLLLISQSTSARLVPPSQVKPQARFYGTMHADSSSTIKIQEDDIDIDNLMGLETCNDSDEACLKRRMVEEAHLDYIYTQHHKSQGSP